MYTNPFFNTISSPSSYQDSSKSFYVSPTYKSSIFNHTQSWTPTGREARHAVNQPSSASRDTWERGSGARVVFDVKRIVQDDYQKDLANIEKRKQDALQRRKPTSEDIKSYESFQIDYQKMMLRRKTEIHNEKSNYGKDLLVQMEERSRRRTLEIEEMRQLGQKRQGLSLSMNASPIRELYASVGRGSTKERETSQGKIEENENTGLRGKNNENENNSKRTERSKEVKKTQLPYSNNYVVAQTVRGQGSLERILNKAMKSPKGNSTERRPILFEKERSPTKESIQSLKIKAEKPSQTRVQSAKQIGTRNPSAEKIVVKKKPENKSLSANFNPLMKDKPVVVNKTTRMRRSTANIVNQDEDELEELRPENEIEYDREAVDYMRNKKLEQISRLTGSVGKQSELLLDVIDEDPSLQFNDDDLDEEQISISLKRPQSDEKDDNYAPRIMDLKGFFKSKINGNELRALESDRARENPENPESLSRRNSNSDRLEQKDILEALMEKRKDLLSYLRGLKGRLSTQTANKRDIEKIYGQRENERLVKNIKAKDKKADLAKQKLLQQGRSTTVKPINELIMAQILERQRASRDEQKREGSMEIEQDRRSDKYKGYEPSHGSTDVFNKQMKILQQYKKNMKFLGYPENYSSAGPASKMI